MHAIVGRAKGVIGRHNDARIRVRARKVNRPAICVSGVIELILGHDIHAKSHAAGTTSGRGHCVLAVFKVALNVPLPLVSVESAGSTAWPSLLVKCTVPAYPVAVLPKASLAVTVKFPAVPAVTSDGKPDTAKVFAAAGLTMIPV